MRKPLLLFAVMFSTVVILNAQDPKPFQLSLGVNLGLPIADMGTVNSFGIGGKLQAEIPVSPQFTGIGSASYNRFFYKSDYKTTLGSGFNTVPIQVGARFYPIEKFLVGFQLGYGIISGLKSINGSKTSTGGLAFNPHAGMNAKNFQLLLGFQGIAKKMGYPGTVKNGTQGWLEFGALVKL